MGLDDGHVTNLDMPRTAPLRILRNGVVPQQATQAISALVQQASILWQEPTAIPLPAIAA